MKKVKSSIIATIITIVIGFILNYITLPVWNLRAKSGWGIMLILIGIWIFSFISSYVSGADDLKDKAVKDIFKVGISIFLISALIFGIGTLIGAQIFNAKTYSSQISVEEADFSKEIEDSDTITDIALMDTSSAQIIGNRTLGTLSQIVSQYEVSESYTQICYHGKPMKVAPLEYAGFFKWFNNKKDGIPGYVMVDPVNNDAEYIECSKPIKYSPSSYFGNNLQRKLRFDYPTSIIEDINFEVDEDGNPYWVASVSTPTAGLFGARKIKSVIVLDACDGTSQKYDLDNVPDWIDNVYTGRYITERYNWYGTLQNGFFNSIISQNGCRKTTDDFGYKVINNDVYVYTGVTSLLSDQSNIGFIMVNCRTGEYKYFNVNGAEEFSAMEAAEGEVQQYGYEASFPSLINVKGHPTYIMVLKDSNSIVKMYAMVNVEDYNIVVTAKTQDEVFAKYKKAIGIADTAGATNESSDKEEIDESKLDSASITVQNIQYIVSSGETTVYITDSNGKVYKSQFNEFFITTKVGDTINIKYSKDNENNSVIELYSFSK